MWPIGASLSYRLIYNDPFSMDEPQKNDFVLAMFHYGPLTLRWSGCADAGQNGTGHFKWKPRSDNDTHTESSVSPLESISQYLFVASLA